MQRFLQRGWRLVVNEDTGELNTAEVELDPKTASLLAQTIESVRKDMEGLKFNTAIAKLIELVNSATQTYTNNDLPTPLALATAIAQMIAPLAPHFAEELWAKLGQSGSVHRSSFPEPDLSAIVEDTVTMIIQVNGKVRDRLEVAPDITEEQAQELALNCDAVSSRLDGEPRKVIVRAPKLVNVVA